MTNERNVVPLPIGGGELPELDEETKRLLPEVAGMFRDAVTDRPWPSREQCIPLAKFLSFFAAGSFLPKPPLPDESKGLALAAAGVLEAIRVDISNTKAGLAAAEKSNNPGRESVIAELQRRLQVLREREAGHYGWMRGRGMQSGPKKRGKPPEPWITLAEDFARLARHAWQEAGRPKGPIVPVVCAALRMATGTEFLPANVARALQRHAKRPRTQAKLVLDGDAKTIAETKARLDHAIRNAAARKRQKPKQ